MRESRCGNDVVTQDNHEGKKEKVSLICRIVVGYKVVLNFDFRNGAKKLGNLSERAK